MNIMGGCGGGGNLPHGKVSPPHLNPHVSFHFYVMIKAKGLRAAWSFEVLYALQEDAGKNSSYLVAMNSQWAGGGGGQSTPG